jgi:hypothetical protein
LRQFSKIAADDTLEAKTGERDEQQKTDDIRAEARRQQNDSAGEDEGAVKEFFSGSAPCSKLAAYARKNLQSLRSSKVGAGNAGEKDHRDSRAKSNQGVYSEKDVNLDYRDQREDKQQSYKHFFLSIQKFLTVAKKSN